MEMKWNFLLSINWLLFFIVLFLQCRKKCLLSKSHSIMTTKQEMIEIQLKGRDIHDPKVIDAMAKVDRMLFVPAELKNQAYKDGPLPIGKEQTISQPYIVAYMAQALRLTQEDVVLEIGTGCGYNAAVLSRLVRHVYSIEIIDWLAKLAIDNLAKTDFRNISILHGDGFMGWPEKAPFDAIELTAAPQEIPSPLKNQLKVGGRLLGPVGNTFQSLVLLFKMDTKMYDENILHPVRFVPMTGRAQELP
jgi:protein-L-isoaspartate(D-aspartate) O-methyltransferase